MKELDVLFERYYEHRYRTADAAEQRAFAALLEHEDPEIWQWLMDQAAAPPGLADVVARLRRHD